MVTCPQCGRENADNSKFCVHCGATITQMAAQPQAPGPGQPQPMYQAPYRAPRAPFAGNLQDHPPFVIALVLAIISGMGMALRGGLMENSLTAFDNNVLRFLFGVVYLAGGVVCLAGCIGLWRFREWGRMGVVAGQVVFAVAGVMTLNAGGRHGGGTETAGVILNGVLILVMAGAVIFYMFTDEVRSRMQH